MKMVKCVEMEVCSENKYAAKVDERWRYEHYLCENEDRYAPKIDITPRNYGTMKRKAENLLINR